MHRESQGLHRAWQNSSVNIPWRQQYDLCGLTAIALLDTPDGSSGGDPPRCTAKQFPPRSSPDACDILSVIFECTGMPRTGRCILDTFRVGTQGIPLLLCSIPDHPKLTCFINIEGDDDGRKSVCPIQTYRTNVRQFEKDDKRLNSLF
jgi:hypothetical protein